MLYGIDAHPVYQRGLRIGDLPGEGFSFMIMKCTEGMGYEAPNWNGWVSDARSAGIIPGAYHWIRAGDGAAQAGRFLSKLDKVGGPEGMLCALDCESDGGRDTIRAFVDEWKRHTSHPLIVYTGAWWWPEHCGGTGSDLSPYLWHARYVTGSGYASSLYGKTGDSWWNPRYGNWNAATMLQFSSKGTVAGISGNVDVDAFRGSLDDLRWLAGIGSAPTTTSEEVDMNVEQERVLRHVEEMLKTVIRNEDFSCGSGGEWNAVGDNMLKRAIAESAGGTLTDTQLPALAASVREGLAAEVASLLAPQFRQVAQVAEAIGKAGEELAKADDAA